MTAAVKEPTGLQLQYAAVCTECNAVIGAGEWARSASGGFRHLHRCPQFAKTCTTCWLQHAGECP